MPCMMVTDVCEGQPRSEMQVQCYRASSSVLANLKYKNSKRESPPSHSPLPTHSSSLVCLGFDGFA